MLQVSRGRPPSKNVVPRTLNLTGFGRSIVSDSQVGNPFSPDIMTPEEVARFLRKSPSWVYKHARELGARKLGGFSIFPQQGGPL